MGTTILLLTLLLIVVSSLAASVHAGLENKNNHDNESLRFLIASMSIGFGVVAVSWLTKPVYAFSNNTILLMMTSGFVALTALLYKTYNLVDKGNTVENSQERKHLFLSFCMSLAGASIGLYCLAKKMTGDKFDIDVRTSFFSGKNRTSQELELDELLSELNY